MVLSVVLDHPKIRADESMFQSLADDVKAKFDLFDGANNEAARGFLNKSISDELRKTILLNKHINVMRRAIFK